MNVSKVNMEDNLILIFGSSVPFRLSSSLHAYSSFCDWKFCVYMCYQIFEYFLAFQCLRHLNHKFFRSTPLQQLQSYVGDRILQILPFRAPKEPMCCRATREKGLRPLPQGQNHVRETPQPLGNGPKSPVMETHLPAAGAAAGERWQLEKLCVQFTSHLSMQLELAWGGDVIRTCQPAPIKVGCMREARKQHLGGGCMLQPRLPPHRDQGQGPKEGGDPEWSLEGSTPHLGGTQKQGWEGCQGMDYSTAWRMCKQGGGTVPP